MPFGKKQAAAAAPAAPAPSGGDGQRSDEIENLRAILQGAGINPDDYNEVWIWCERFNVPLGVAKLG